MKDEQLFHDYANFKLENADLFSEMKKQDSLVLERFSHVLDVVDFYYDKLIDNPDFNDEDEEIFSAGFMYLQDQVDQIKELLSKVYDNNIKNLDHHAKEINLLLNTYDFQSEVVTHGFTPDKDVEVLMNFDQDIYDLILNKKEVPSQKYVELDELTYRIFKKNNRDYYSINTIFLEIADELEIL